MISTHRLAFGKKFVGLAKSEDGGQAFIALGDVATILPSFRWDPAEPPAKLHYFSPQGQAYIALDDLPTVADRHSRPQQDAAAALLSWAKESLKGL